MIVLAVTKFVIKSVMGLLNCSHEQIVHGALMSARSPLRRRQRKLKINFQIVCTYMTLCDC